MIASKSYDKHSDQKKFVKRASDEYNIKGQHC